MIDERYDWPVLRQLVLFLFDGIREVQRHALLSGEAEGVSLVRCDAI